MKIEIKESVTKCVEIELPYYAKKGCHFFKLYSEKNCLKVCDLEGHESIGVSHAGIVFIDNENKDSNEIEFREAYERVNKTLKSKISNI